MQQSTCRGWEEQMQQEREENRKTRGLRSYS